ncbi:hypothetical protein [Nocardia sp. NPDC057030]|uniref:hypothetical protein n=1 Tax=unclassified Nocardia TaxID=2637762 RepID=UPI00362C0B39
MARQRTAHPSPRLRQPVKAHRPRLPTARTATDAAAAAHRSQSIALKSPTPERNTDMSDRSPEEELIAEAVKFGRSFQQMLRAHAQAAHWLERRRIRKQISLALREQRRAEQAARDHHLGWTQQMIDHYRVHAATVAERAENPNIDHARRHRDSQILAEHSDYLRSKILDNSRLTLTERGIALDGLDAATVFPHLKTGRLFARAHKVKGIDALHYRALVAREKTGYAQRVQEAPQGQDAVRENRQHTSPASAGRDRFAAHVGPAEAIELVKDPRSPRIAREDLPRTGTFETREHAYDWTVQQLGDYHEHSNFRDGQFSARIYEWNHPDRAEHVDGPIGMVTDEIGALREQHERQPRAEQVRPAQPSDPTVDNSRIAQIERQLTDMAADRDRLASRVEILQRGLDAVTADRDEVKRRLGSADARIEELKNRNLRLANEISEHSLTVGQVAAERDRYKGERDEAVAKLVRSTPESARYGSRSRSANGSTRPSGDRPTPPNRDHGNGNGDRLHDDQASHEEVRRDFEDLVRQNMSDALTDQDSEVIRRQVQRIEDRGGPIGAPQATEFVNWWANGGAEEYWAEKRSREQAHPEPADQRENTQPWRAEDLDTSYERTVRPERNGKRRNGIERSR